MVMVDNNANIIMYTWKNSKELIASFKQLFGMELTLSIVWFSLRFPISSKCPDEFENTQKNCPRLPIIPFLSP